MATVNEAELERTFTERGESRSATFKRTGDYSFYTDVS